MLRIRLFCANGMSTSLLVKKMEEAAKEKGKEVDIKAYPILDMERMWRSSDRRWAISWPNQKRSAALQGFRWT